MYLTKINKDNIELSNYEMLSFNIKKYLQKNPNHKGLLIEDFKGNIHYNINEPRNIIQIFLNKLVCISSHSFQQNHKIIGKQIRNYVSKIIHNTGKINQILCIGGESYLYGLITNNLTLHLTNSKFIKNDCDYNFNNLIQSRQLKLNKLINYECFEKEVLNNNDDSNILNSHIAILNLSKLLVKIIEVLNNSNINKLIIINCHHNDFWKKIILLNNYSLIQREKFICYGMNYFITVNIFIRKSSIIPLGNNCSVAYQMNKLRVRNVSYPFDWCASTLPKINKILKDNFKDFSSSLKIKKKSYKHIPVRSLFKHDVENNWSYIISNKYGINFAHEVINTKSLDEFKESMIRRIDRFMNLKNPIFVRLELKKVNKSNYKKLISLLDNYFTNYKLIVLSNQIIKDTEKINFIKINKTFIDWKYDNIDWKTILCDV